MVPLICILGVKKKLLASKDQELTPWVRAVANHLWYCAATCEKKPQKLKEKWISLLHHITDEHEWVTGEHMHQCEHPAYTEE